MGAWSSNTFGNDMACDWSTELEDADDLQPVEDAIDLVNDAAGDFIDADDGCAALAACEVIARLKGHWGVRDAYSETVDAWVESHPIKPSASLTKKAKAAIKHVLGGTSELAELWEGDPQWLAAVADLQSRVAAKALKTSAAENADAKPTRKKRTKSADSRPAEGSFVLVPLGEHRQAVTRVIWNCNDHKEVVTLAVYDVADMAAYLQAPDDAWRCGYIFAIFSVNEIMAGKVPWELVPGPDLTDEERRLPVFTDTSGLCRRDVVLREPTRSDHESYPTRGYSLSGSVEFTLRNLLGLETSLIDRVLPDLPPDRSASKRSGAAAFIGKVGRAAAGVLPALYVNARDANCHVRRSASIAIGNIGVATPEAIATLEAACNDPHEEVRLAARESLTLLPGGIGKRGLREA